MRRPSPPSIGLNVPHRIGAARLPGTRRRITLGPGGGRRLRHERPPSRIRQAIAAVGMIGAVATTFWFIFGVVINPRATRHPPTAVLLAGGAVVATCFLLWAASIAVDLFQERRARRRRHDLGRTRADGAGTLTGDGPDLPTG